MEKYKAKKRIIVGGGAGYIGSSLVPQLIHAGHTVTVIDLLWFGNYLPKKTRVIKKDLFEISRKELKEYDEFIFLAGVSNDPMAHYNPRLNYLYNASLPAYLAYESKKAGIKRFIYGSSCSVYGNMAKMCTEKDTPNTSEPYGISKLQGEYGVLKNSDKTFSTIIFRQGTVCGYSPRMRLDLALNTMVKNAIQNGQIVVNNPTIWRPICAMNDLVHAYELAIQAKPSINGIFNITSGNFQIQTMAKTIQKSIKLMLKKDISIMVRHDKTNRDYRVSLAKSKKILKFKPVENLPSLAKELISKIADMSDFNNPKYYNIDTFKQINLHKQPVIK